MKKIIFLVFVVMLCQAPAMLQACEELPIFTSSAHILDNVTALPGSPYPASKNGMEFVLVKGGCFHMGTAAGVSGDSSPRHPVCVDNFYMGKYEVTQAQWRRVMGSNPSTISSCGESCPVVDVSWQDVQVFIRRLNKITGDNYRLPTEAEWEYAVSNGEMQDNSGIASAAALDSKRALRPVGLSQPNGFGIYDMQGNVWEWTGDWYSMSYYGKSPVNNPSGPEDGRYRVLRGGSWDDTSKSIQKTLRARYRPTIKRPWIGFRLTLPDHNSAKTRDRSMVAPLEIKLLNIDC